MSFNKVDKRVLYGGFSSGYVFTVRLGFGFEFQSALGEPISSGSIVMELCRVEFFNQQFLCIFNFVSSVCLLVRLCVSVFVL